MDDSQRLSRLQLLAYRLFIDNKEGVEFLELMKLQHVATKTFPQPAEYLAAFGGGVGWAAYREGQVAMIGAIEAIAKDFMDRIEAEQKEK